MTNWSKALQAAISDQADKVPKGWETSAEIGAKLKTKRARTGEVLAMLVKAGKAERRVFKVKVGEQLRQVPHYRVKS